MAKSRIFIMFSVILHFPIPQIEYHDAELRHRRYGDDGVDEGVAQESSTVNVPYDCRS